MTKIEYLLAGLLGICFAYVFLNGLETSRRSNMSSQVTNMKIGDVVRLNSGGPLMTLSSNDPIHQDIWICKWFDDCNHLQVGNFFVDMFHKIKPKPKKV